MKKTEKRIEAKDRNFSSYFLAIIFMLIIPIVAYSYEKFDITPLNINFWGTVQCENKIIVYGDYGTFIFTTDNGRTWGKNTIYPKGNIMQMLYEKKINLLWGIIDNGFIVYSTNCGEKWNLKYFDKLVEGERLLSTIFFENFIFIRSTHKIFKFDVNLNLLDYYQNDSLKIKFSDTFYFYNTLYKTRFYPFKNKLIILSDNYPTLLFILTPELKNMEVVDIRNKVYIREPYYPYIYDIFVLKDTIVINARFNLYQTNDIFGNWNFYFPDSNFVNINDTNFFSKWPQGRSKWEENRFDIYQPQNYFFHNNELYMDIISTSVAKRAIDWGGSGSFSLISYFIRKFKFDSAKKSCYFENFNSFFDDNNYAPVLYKNRMQNATEFLLLKNKAIINDSIFVIPGPYSTIVMSTNSGKNWFLVSCNNGNPEFIIDETRYIFFNKSPNFNSTFLTSDGGITFIPSKVNLDTLLSKMIFIKKDTLGNPIDTIVLYENYDTVTFFPSYERTLLLHIDTTGKGFWLGYNLKKYLIGVPNLAITFDFGLMYKFYNRNFFNFSVTNEIYPSKIFQIQDKYIFTLSFNKNDTNYSYLILCDTSLTSINFKEFPLLEIFQIYPQDSNNYWIFANKQESETLFKKNFVIFQLSNDANSIDTIFSINEELKLIQFYSFNKDTIFFTTIFPSRLYLLDIKNKNLIKLFETEEYDQIYLMVISDRFYIVGRGLFLENTDRSDLTQWRQG
ncbi:MAG: hypothetical protein ACPLKS_07885, partial [Caldisericum exile]|uniref:hypothetical protein n=1 Tax=Caldisericum exile TaxID=693075 RepID=UPI003C71AAF3